MATAAAGSAKIAIVTGANSGIGLGTATILAIRGMRVIMACRSRSRAVEAIEHIQRQMSAAAAEYDEQRSDTTTTHGNIPIAKPAPPPGLAQVPFVPGGSVEFMQLDLASFASIRDFATAFLARKLPLHVLVNNAGLSQLVQMTKGGFELHFMVNFLGPELLTRLLLPRLTECQPSRIVHVSSYMHHAVWSSDYEDYARRNKNPHHVHLFLEYNFSKLCQIWATRVFQEDGPGKDATPTSGVACFAVSPGTVNTNIMKSQASSPTWWQQLGVTFMPFVGLSPYQGAATSVYAALDAKPQEGRGVLFSPYHTLGLDGCLPHVMAMSVQAAGIFAGGHVKGKLSRRARDLRVARRFMKRVDDWLEEQEGGGARPTATHGGAAQKRGRSKGRKKQ